MAGAGKLSDREKKMLLFAGICFIFLALIWYNVNQTPSGPEIETYDMFEKTDGIDVTSVREKQDTITHLKKTDFAFDPFLKPGERNWTQICVQTIPSEAQVVLTSGQRTRQLMTISDTQSCFNYVAREQEYEVRITKPGYEEIVQRVTVNNKEKQANMRFRLDLLRCDAFELGYIIGNPGQRMALLNGVLVYRGMKLVKEGKKVRKIGRNYIILQDLKNPDNICRVDWIKKKVTEES
ncbi:MAG: PEGA domain-containing protein [Desulfobacterales bacterium]|nr:PEGA domain-containing protein [Desulfobacterales bacterium]